MLVELHQEVYATLDNALAEPMWDHFPDAVPELPCVVVSPPDARESVQPSIFDLGVDIWAVGRRQTNESSSELIALADKILAALGGTRAVRTPGRDVIGPTRAEHRTVIIAGKEYPAYLIVAAASATTC